MRAGWVSPSDWSHWSPPRPSAHLITRRAVAGAGSPGARGQDGGGQLVSTHSQLITRGHKSPLVPRLTSGSRVPPPHLRTMIAIGRTQCWRTLLTGFSGSHFIIKAVLLQIRHVQDMSVARVQEWHLMEDNSQLTFQLLRGTTLMTFWWNILKVIQERGCIGHTEDCGFLGMFYLVLWSARWMLGWPQ